MPTPDDDLLHLAIPLIIEAEGTAAFQHNIPAVEALLATATDIDIDPDSLPPLWVARLALRLADIMLQSVQLDRARIWLDAAQGQLDKIADLPDHLALDLRLQTHRARLLALDLQPDKARAHIARLRARLDKLDAPPPAARARLDLVAAELHALERHYPFVEEILDRHLHREGAFDAPDDLWRALGLMAQAHQMCFEFDQAAARYEALRDLCEALGSPLDANDALLGLGQCQIGRGDFQAGLATIALATGRFPDALRHDATARLIGAHLANADPEAALVVAEQAAADAAAHDDYVGYVRLLGVITALYRALQRHKDAYRNLVTIHGFLHARFGDEAAAPIKNLINTLRDDLGEDRFEALAAELLAEMRQRQGHAG